MNRDPHHDTSDWHRRAAALSIDGRAFIAGRRFAGSEAPRAITSPANGGMLAELASCSADDVDTAVAAARRAWMPWARRGALARKAVLLALADLMERDFDELALLESLDSGKPIRQTRTVDVRIIAATNKNLADAIKDGKFREDLYYRLNVFPIALPALSERLEDIPLLAEYFGREVASNMGRRFAGFTPAAVQTMQAYGWPGNIRELQNCVERAIIVAHDEQIDVPDLPRYLFERPAGDSKPTGLPTNLDEELERIERGHLLEALRQAEGVQVKAAEILGISERSFWHRVKKYAISIVKQAG